MRAADGSTARNAYRPVTEPGKYVPTAFTLGWQATEMTPFVLDNAAQFRPGSPPDLRSDTWTKDYNEIKEIGEKNRTQAYTAADGDRATLAGRRANSLSSLGTPDRHC